MDEFAQTRGVDDLFDDDIVPVTAQAEEIPAEQELVNDVLPAEFAVPAGAEDLSYNDDRSNAAHPDYRMRGAGRGRALGDRARGRGRGGFSRRGRGAGPTRDTGQDKGEISAPEPVPASSSADDQTQPTEVTNEAPAPNDDDDSQSKDASKPKVYAVKGDRSGTGGVKKPKLTEDELSERMAAVKIKSAERAAAHARAEADEASFRERERVAHEKQRQERANRRVMIGERERNRQRKLDAQTGREWDAEKKEEMLSAARGRGVGYRRGMHGGVSYDPSRASDSQTVENDWDDGGQQGHYRGRTSRGGRGGGRGRGRGRGRGGGFGRDQNPDVVDGATPQNTSNTPSSPPSFHTENDFPALPSGIEAVTRQELSIPVSNTDPDSPAAATGTWAEQMEPSSRPSQSIGQDGTKSGD